MTWCWVGMSDPGRVDRPDPGERVGPPERLEEVKLTGVRLRTDGHGMARIRDALVRVQTCRNPAVVVNDRKPGRKRGGFSARRTAGRVAMAGSVGDHPKDGLSGQWQGCDARGEGTCRGKDGWLK